MNFLCIMIPTLACLGYGIYGMVQHSRGDYEWYQCSWLWILIISIMGVIMGLSVLAVTELIVIS